MASFAMLEKLIIGNISFTEFKYGKNKNLVHAHYIFIWKFSLLEWHPYNIVPETSGK
jgi:hypothetical protein